jgi:uncharacterized membrane protein
MIRLLSAIGRIVIVLAAVLWVIALVVMGAFEIGTHSPTPDGYVVGGIIGGIVGAIFGLISAGVVFGAIATLYDIRDNLRLLVKQDRNTPGPRT